MDVLSVVVGAFCFFLFQWLFRGIFLLLFFKILLKIVEQGREKMKGEFENAMSILRNDEKQDRE